MISIYHTIWAALLIACSSTARGGECNYTIMVQSAAIVSNCVFNQSVNVSTTQLPIDWVFNNVTFGVLGLVNGPQFVAVPNNSRITFRDGCVLYSQTTIAGSESSGGPLTNVTVILQGASFVRHGRFIVRAAAVTGMIDMQILVSNVVANISCDVGQAKCGLLMVYTPEQTVTPITGLTVSVTGVTGIGAAVDGSFVAVLGVYCGILHNTTVSVQNVSWTTTGVCMETKVISLVAWTLLGPTHVLLRSARWTSRTYAYLPTGSTAVGYVSDTVVGPTTIQLIDVVVSERSDDVSVVQANSGARFGALWTGFSLGRVSVVRGDRTAANATILYVGELHVLLQRATVTLASAMRAAALDLDFSAGPELSLNVTVVACTLSLQVAGAAAPITTANMASVLGGLQSARPDILREASLMSFATLSSCASATVVVRDVRLNATVVFEVNANAALQELNPWMFSMVNLVSLSNVTTLAFTVEDAMIRIGSLSQASAANAPEKAIVHGVISAVFQFIATDEMRSCTVSLRNVSIAFHANVTMASWAPSLQSFVAQFLGPGDDVANSVGVLAITFAPLLLDLHCCTSGELNVSLIDVNATVDIAKATCDAARSSNGGVWLSLVAFGPVGKRAVLSGLNIPLIANSLQQKFGTPKDGVNMLRNAQIVMQSTSLLLDSASTYWVDTVLASGSDGPPFNGVPPPGTRSTFGGLLFLGGAAFVPTGQPRNVSGSSTLLATNASSIVWIENCTLRMMRSASLSPTCASFPPTGQPSAALMSLRWAIFERIGTLPPTVIAVVNVTMDAIDEVSRGNAIMAASIVHSDYSSVTSASSSGLHGVVLLITSLSVHMPGTTSAVDACRRAAPRLTIGWSGVLLGAQSNTSLCPVQWSFRFLLLRHLPNVSITRVFDAPFAWASRLSSLPSSLVVQCNSVDYVRPLTISMLGAPRWAVTALPPAEDSAGHPQRQCPDIWTATPTPVAAAPVTRATSTEGVGVTLMVASGVSAVLTSSLLGHLGSSTFASRMQTSASVLDMRARCGVEPDEDDSDVAADLAIAASVSDNPTGADITSFGPWTSSAGGALLANTALVISFALLGPALSSLGTTISRAFRGGRGKEASDEHRLQPTGMDLSALLLLPMTLLPGQGSTVFSTLLQPTFASCVALLLVNVYPSYENTSATGAVVLGLVGIFVVVVSAVVTVWHIIHAERHGLLVGRDPTTVTRRRSSSCRTFVSVLFEATEWSCGATKRGSVDAVAFARRYAPVYEGYRRRYVWFISCEWAASLMCGLFAALSTLPSTMRSPPACIALVWAVTVASVTLALLVCLLRPYASRFDNINNIVQAASTAAVAIIAALDTEGGSSAPDWHWVL